MGCRVVCCPRCSCCSDWEPNGMLEGVPTMGDQDPVTHQSRFRTNPLRPEPALEKARVRTSLERDATRPGRRTVLAAEQGSVGDAAVGVAVVVREAAGVEEAPAGGDLGHRDAG